MADKPQSITDMFSALGNDLKLPKVDVDALIDHHRKNLEALQEAASASATGASVMLARQREMLEQAIQDMAAMTRDLSAGTPQEAMARQAAYVRQSFDSAIKNASELQEIIQESSAESVDILKRRIREAIDQAGGGFGKGA